MSVSFRTTFADFMSQQTMDACAQEDNCIALLEGIFREGSILARIMVQGDVSNVSVYDPAAGSGTLVLALAHQIGEQNCTIFTQDISAKSNEFLRLNLILNNLVHSLGNVVHDDTLIAPRHLNARKNGLAKFDYIVSNPPCLYNTLLP